MQIPASLKVRRATTDDLVALKTIWKAMQLPADELEKRLTEFQIIQDSAGKVVGAIGIRFSKQHALLHNEGYSDFSVADEARQLFWKRIQVIASNHGIFRIWTQENSLFWIRWGFQSANAEILARLPAEWKTSEGKWLTFQLKNEEAIALLEKELAVFKESEKLRTAETLDRARTLITVITVVGFAVGIILIVIAIYLLIHRGPFSR